VTGVVALCALVFVTYKFIRILRFLCHLSRTFGNRLVIFIIFILFAVNFGDFNCPTGIPYDSSRETAILPRVSDKHLCAFELFPTLMKFCEIWGFCVVSVGFVAIF